MSSVPSRPKLRDATLEVLKRSEGAFYISQIASEVARLFELSAEVLKIPSTHPNDPRTKFQYELAWARTELKEEGLVKNVARGMWELASAQESIRLAALSRITELSEYWNWAIPWGEIEKGFHVAGKKFEYAVRDQGIYKPEGLDAALSIKTSVPHMRGAHWHQNQELGALESHENTETLDCNFGRQDIPNSEALKVAIDEKTPMIYFHGIAHNWYQPLAPVWGVSLDQNVISLSMEEPTESAVVLPEGIARSYSMAIHKSRNHQARFSTRVREAYGWKCGLSGLPVRELLTGCHIVPDAEGGEASIRNGISMSTLHHSAYDRNLIGIDSQLKVHVSPTLRNQSDGEVLEALKNLQGERLTPPERPEDHPDRDFLEHRFKIFKSTF